MNRISAFVNKFSIRGRLIISFSLLFVVSNFFVYFGFYRSSIDSMRQRVEDSTVSMSNHLAQQIEKIFSQMDLINQIFSLNPRNRELVKTSGLDYLEQIRNYWILHEELVTLGAYFSDYNLAIYLRDDSLLANDRTMFFSNYYILDGVVDIDVIRSGGHFWTSNEEINRSITNQTTPVISSYRIIGYYPDSHEDLFLIRTAVSKKYIKDLFDTAAQPALYYLIDTEGGTVVSSSGTDYASAADTAKTGYHFITNTLSVNNWRLVTGVPLNYYSESLRNTRIFFLVLIVLLFAAFIVLLRIIIRNFIKVENEKKQTELNALQSQIKPHFIYNTLDSINWMALDKGHTEVSKAIVTLAAFLRKSLSFENELVSFKEEVEYARLYVNIMNMRSDCKITLKEDFDDTILSRKTIKFVLQPVVENSIIHGFYDAKRKDGVVTMRGRISDGKIWITVTDNGKGYSPGTKTGYGLRSIEYRLKLFHGENAGIRVEAAEGTGTVTHLWWEA